MGREIERKFLVTSEAWRAGARGESYRQGYLLRDPERTVRVRLAAESGWITIKGPGRLSRTELEYTIPRADAEELLAMCDRPLVEKTRYRIEHAGHTFEVDEFHGDNAGLVVAELELEREDEPFTRPPWLGEEVTDDARYANANLVAHPYSAWRGS